MNIVYVATIHEDSVDDLDTKVYVHRTLEGLYQRLFDYIIQLKTYQWECAMPHCPSLDDVKKLLSVTNQAVTLYKLGDFSDHRFTIEFTAQRHRLGD